MAARKRNFLQFGHHILQDPQSFLPFLVRERWRRLIIVPLDQLAGRGNAHAAENSFRLTDVNLLGRKVNVRAKVFELRVVDLSLSALKRQADLSVAHVERVEKRLMMKQRRIIDIERYLADERQCILALFVIENSYVLRNQPAEWIERQSPDGGFHATLAQFFGNAPAPMPAKPFSREIPSANEQRGYNDDDSEAKHAPGKSAPQSRLLT